MNQNELTDIVGSLEVRGSLTYLLPEDVERRCLSLSTYPLTTVNEIGKSREGRPLFAVEIGEGKKVICAIGNAHAEEVTGTVTLIYLAERLSKEPLLKQLLDNYKFLFLPQVNPDGMMRNSGWIKKGYRYDNFILHHYRDLPEDDVEHGFSTGDAFEIRAENKAMTNFFNNHRNIDYYITLHSTPLTGGAAFLLNADNIKECEPLLDFISNHCHKRNLPLVEEDTGGVLGFKMIKKGFFTTPTFEEIQKFFSGNEELAKQIKLNSYQYVKSHCNSRLTMISELPFVYDIALGDTELTGLSRYSIAKQGLVNYKRKTEELKTIIGHISKFNLNQNAKDKFNYYANQLKLADAFTISMEKEIKKLKGKKAYRTELLELYVSKHKNRYNNAAIAIDILRECEDKSAKPMLKEYENIFREAYSDFERRMDLKILPLEKQVELQSAMILGGVLVI